MLKERKCHLTASVVTIKSPDDKKKNRNFNDEESDIFIQGQLQKQVYKVIQCDQGNSSFLFHLYYTIFCWFFDLRGKAS